LTDGATKQLNGSSGARQSANDFVERLAEERKKKEREELAEINRIRERMLMENEDDLSMQRERREADELYKARKLMFIPPAVPVIPKVELCLPKSFTIDVGTKPPAVSFDDFGPITEALYTKVEYESSDMKEKLAKNKEKLEKLNFFKKRTGKEEPLLTDRILSKNIREEKAEENLALVFSNKMSSIQPSQLQSVPTHTIQIDFGRFGNTQQGSKPRYCTMSSNLQKLLDEHVSEGFAKEINDNLKQEDESKVVRMYTSGYFSQNLLVRTIDSAEISASRVFLSKGGHIDKAVKPSSAATSEFDDTKLTRYCMKLESLPVLSSIAEILPEPINILEATLNHTESILSPDQARQPDFKPHHFLQSLISLDLSNNLIQDYSALGQFKTLQILKLDSNKLTALQPLALPSLLDFSAANNKIEKIAHFEGLAKRLKKLDLSGNLITKIENLGQLRYLELLDLSRNRISRVENLNQNLLLREIVLFGNSIVFVEPVVSLMLEKLLLSDNKLTSLDLNITAPNLTTLSLKGNQIETIAQSVQLLCPRLSELNLSFNPLPEKELIKILSKLPGIKSLDYSVKSPQDSKILLPKLLLAGENLAKFNNEPVHHKSLRRMQPIFSIRQEKIDKAFYGEPFDRLHLNLVMVSRGRYAFSGRISPVLLRIMAGLDKFLKICHDPYKICLLNFIKMSRAGVPLKIPVVDIYQSKAQFEQSCHKSIQKVVRFLKKIIRKKRERRAYYLAHQKEIIKIQKVYRGHNSRKKWSHKKNPLIFHKKHLKQIVKCQKLIRGRKSVN
jgi:hypothetical protein